MRITVKVGAMLLGFLAIAACSDSGNESTLVPNPDDGKNNPDPISYGVLNGRISNGNGIEGVTVSVNNIETETDSKGVFQLSNIPLSGSRWVVSLSKEGYVDSQKIVQIQAEEEQYQLDAFLTQPDTIQTVDLTQAQTVKTSGYEIQIALPANAIQGGDDASIITLTYGDPSSERGQAIFPGDFSATNDPNVEPDVLLESIGFLDISASSENGTDLTQLSEPAEVTLRLPQQYQTGGERAGEYQHGDSIPWWSYDETLGTWLREDADPSTPELDDAAIIENNTVLYAVASVTHFSWWNVDKPIDQHACVKVTLVDKNNEPMPNQKVFAQGNSFQFSTSTLSNAQGEAFLTIKRTLDASSPETFSLFTKLGGSKLTYDVTSSSEGFTGSDLLFSPTQSGSSLQGDTENCVTLENNLRVAFDGSISGVLLNGSGEPIADTMVYTDLSQSVLTNENGQFTFDVPLNLPVYIIIPDLHTEQYQATTAAPNINIEIITGNQAPVIENIQITPPSDIKTGDDVQLNAVISDADNDSLTINWSASVGVFSDETSSETTWTAPAEPGSTQLILTINDGVNENVSQSIFISWTDAVVSQEFTLQAHPLDNPDAQLSGITVILHGEDNISVEQVKQTDESGLVNFGMLDRDRVTYTVVETMNDVEYEQESYSLSTNIGMLNQPSVFIVESNSAPIETGCTEQVVNVELINIPQETLWVNGEFVRDTIILEEGVEQSITICTSYNNITPPYYVFTVYDSGYSPIGHSQAITSFTENGVTQIDLSKQFIDVPVVNNLGAQAAVYSINPQYTGAPISYYDEENSRVRFYDVPVETYHFFAGSNGEVERVNLSWSETQRPESIILNKPDYSLSNIEFNNLNQSVSWQSNNADQADTLQIFLSGYMNNWYIAMSPSYNSFTLPELPEAYADLRNLERYSYQRNVSLRDYENFNSLDELIKFVFSQEPTLELFMTISTNSVEYEVAEPQ
jgi:hypothetical protein